MTIAWITSKIDQQLIRNFYAAHGEVRVFTPLEFAPIQLPRPSNFNVIVIELLDRPLLDTCEAVCREKIAPVLAIVPNSAYAQAALEAGADDFLVAPVDPIEALLRLGKLKRISNFVRVGDLEIDLSAGKVWLRGNHIRLSSLEFRLLASLAKRVGQIVSHAEIMEDAWGKDLGTLVRVKNCVNRVRQKLEPDIHHPQYIVTFSKQGYRLRNHRQWKEYMRGIGELNPSPSDEIEPQSEIVGSNARCLP